MITAIVFDLDNTLVDFMRMKHDSCDAAIQAMIGAGLEMSKSKALKLLYELYDEYGIEDKLIFQKFLRKELGKIDWKILSAGIIAYRKIKVGRLDPYPGTQETLLKLKLKGIKLAILSDAPRMRAWLRLTSMRLADFFDIVVTYEDTKHHKPHPSTFKTALKKLDLMPEEVLMVGDWPQRDIVGAKKVGMKTCLAKYGCVKPIGKSNPDIIIDKITDLPFRIKRL